MSDYLDNIRHIVSQMKRPAKNGDEQDCFFSRKLHKYLDKPGRSANIKRNARRRERREAKQDTNHESKQANTCHDSLESGA
jgi:hypothetical protein